MKILIPVCLFAIASCQNNSDFKELNCMKFEYYNSDEMIDSANMKIIFRDNADEYDFSFLTGNDSLNIKIKKDDTDYQFLQKSFQINDDKIILTRIDNELVAPIDGREYHYLQEDGRPILIKLRDWASYQTFITNESDKVLLNELRNDTTCFFRCIPKTPPKPTY